MTRRSLRALEEPGGFPLLRDLRRLHRLTVIACVYWTRGLRLRRAYRKAQARGETLWLDEWSERSDDRAPSAR